MPDAGEVKAKVTIEYDGGGLGKAKEALKDFASSAGDAVDAANKLSDATSNAGSSAGDAAGKTQGFADAIGAVKRPAEEAGQAVSEMAPALEEAGKAADETGGNLEDLKTQVAATTEETAKLAPTVAANTAQFQRLNEQLPDATANMAQMTTATSESSKAINQQVISGQAQASQFETVEAASARVASNQAAINALYEDAVPTARQLQASGLATYFDEVRGATLTQTAAIQQAIPVQQAQISSIDNTAKALDQSVPAIQATTAGVADLADVSQRATKPLEDLTTSLHGSSVSNNFVPTTFSDFIDSLPEGEIAATGFDKAVAGMGQVFGGLSGALESVAMPIMAVQMIGMAVQAVGSAIYSSAAIAEGSGAHGVGTFTGAIDEMAQSAAKAGDTFAENFGQGILPTLAAINSQGTGGFSGFVGGVASFLGAAASTISNTALILTGNPAAGIAGFINQYDQATGQPLQYPGSVPTAQATAQVATTQAMQQMPTTLVQNAQKMDQQSYMTIAQSQDPAYLHSVGMANAANQIAASTPIPYVSRTDALLAYNNQKFEAQQATAYASQPTYGQIIGGDIASGNWGGVNTNMSNMLGLPNGGGPTNQVGAVNNSQMPFGIQPGNGPGWVQQANNALEGVNSTVGGWGQGFNNTMGGIGQGFQNGVGGFGAWLNGLFGGDVHSNAGGGMTGDVTIPDATSTGGCFVAGTPVLLADGTERPIEALRVSDVLSGQDGTTTVLACISYPAKRVYELLFANGKTLVTTDSHPIATQEGWKAIDPASAKEENPSLHTTPLLVGDRAYTIKGTLTTLVMIRAQKALSFVYNVNVDKNHTYYANGILVHNGKMAQTLGPQIAQNIQSTPLPPISFQQQMGAVGASISSSPIVAKATWAVSGAEKAIAAAGTWTVSGAEKAINAAAAWTVEGAEKAIAAAAQWTVEGAEKAIAAAAQWTVEGAEKAIAAAAQWTVSGAEKAIAAAGTWTVSGAEKAINAAAKWTAENLTPVFNAIPNWVTSNLNPTFNVSALFTGIPGLAGGTDNWQGGPAFIAENGPELVQLPSGSSVTPLTNTPGPNNLNPIALGGGGSSSGPVTIQLYVDSMMLAQQILPQIAPLMRVSFGGRR